MNPKPPVTRTGRSGRQATRFKSLAVLGALVLGVAGAAFAAATPALADPAPNFTAIGSDTTQNLMDSFAANAGQGSIGSWDAVNPLSQVTAEQITAGPALPGGQQELCSFTRPNGSGQGFKTLDFSYNPSTTLNPGLVPANNPQPGCVSMSRSSSGPGSVASSGPGAKLATGNFVYIPYAIDAVGLASGPSSQVSDTTLCNGPTTPSGYTCSSTTGTGNVTFTGAGTNFSQTADLSVAQLQRLYASCQPLPLPNGTTLNPNAGTFNFSATSASPAVFTATNSTGAAAPAYTAGQQLILSGPTGSAPGGFTDGTTYFVVNPSANTFQLSATSGGAAIASTSTGFGVVAPPGTVDLYAPQAGSGTLSFWESTMGVTAVQSCWHQTIAAGPATGVLVEEHDGTAIASDPNGIFPNSIAKWSGMSQGQIVPDLRHGSQLQSVTPSFTFTATSASPAVFTTGTTSNYAANTQVTLLGTGGTSASLPGGFSEGTTYFVTAPTASTFELSATSGGAAINSTSTGSGTVSGGTVVAPLNGGGTMNVSGCLTGTHFVQSACFPVTREVYNVVDFYEVNNTAPTQTIAFTATSANPAVFTATGSSYTNGQLVTLTGSSLPGGFTAQTNYYACNTTTNTFELCSTPQPGVLSPASAPLASSSTGSGGVSDNPAFNSVLAGLLAGTSSGMCTSSFLIGQEGFGPIPVLNSAFPDACGATTAGNRVQMNNASANG